MSQEWAVRVGAPFNPYRVFQGVFAPYWILEHRGISTGAKLCHIRLLGFAGKDARCYPSLETLGTSLGVSERQARDYVKELERAGLLAVEQRGLRKTNLYLFLWTAELEQLSNFVPDRPDDPNEPSGKPSSEGTADQNNRSGQAGNRASALDRNSCSGPIGINSAGINSVESSSSSADCQISPGEPKMTTSFRRELGVTDQKQSLSEPTNRTAELILRWAKERSIQRLRSDRHVGLPDQKHLTQWAGIFDARGVTSEEQVYSVLDLARTSADRFGSWRNWAFLTLQIQLAAEQFDYTPIQCAVECSESQGPGADDPESDWAKAKVQIRSRVSEISFLNWFACTRQTGRCGSEIEVAVPNECTGAYLKEEYDHVISTALSELGVNEIHFVVANE